MDRTNSAGGDDAIPPALSAILNEMRSDEIETEDGVVRLDGYADRIESEVRRAHEEWEAVARAQDVAQTVMMEEIEKLRAPGSVAAMRKALKRVESELSTMNPRGWGDTLAYVRAALAAPARNCDVGTPDEQAERFEAECKRYAHCTPCPIHAAWGEFREGKPKSCQLIWAQMPFAQPEGEVK